MKDVILIVIVIAVLAACGVAIYTIFDITIHKHQ